MQFNDYSLRSRGDEGRYQEQHHYGGGGVSSSSSPPSSSRYERDFPQDSRPRPRLLQQGNQRPLSHHPHSGNSSHGLDGALPSPPSLNSLRAVRPSLSRNHSAPNSVPRVPLASSATVSSSNDNPVLDRMRGAGWSDVAAKKGDENEGYEYKHGSIDSGYGTEGTSHGEEGEEKAGYLGGWSSLKKAVGWSAEGEDGGSGSVTPVPSTAEKSALGSHYWESLTQKLHVTSTIWAEEDDGAIGKDGETRLGRAIKEYHFSRATSVEDVPEWLFTPQELAARRRAGPTRRRSSVQDFNPNLPGGSIRTRRLSERKQSLVDFNPNAAPVVDSPAKEERERRRRGEEQSTIAEEPSGGYGGYGGSGSRATDKLRAMREAKRVMH